MKKLCVCLALLLILIGTFGCAKEEEIVAPILSVGYGKADITPTTSLPLDGYGTTGANAAKNRWSTAQETPFSAICIAFTDADDKTVLFMTLDLLNAYMADGMRAAISKDTGVPKEQIMFQCTHNHSGPALRMSSKPEVAEYLGQLTQGVLEAARAALADRKPATQMFTTFSRPEGINSVRHYLLENGTYAGDNFGSFKSAPIASHETDADNQLQLVCFNRETSADIILANFQTHPHRESSSTNTNVTADIIAPFREKMEATIGCHFAYFTGASGNINPTSRIEEENVTRNYIEQGHALADYAIAAYSTFQEIPTTSVKITKTMYKAKVDHTYSRWGKTAVDAIAYYMQNGDLGVFKTLLKDSGIKNVYQLNAVGIRSTMPQEYEIPIYAVSLGDLAFVTVPFEMFDTNGMQIKEGSPFSMTFVLTCANTNLSYLPSELAFKHGGYAVDVTLFVRGTAEGLVASYLDMLDSLYYGK